MKKREELGHFDFEIYTDGSVVNQVGVGVGNLYRDGDSVPFKSVMSPSGFLSTSYRSEQVGIHKSLDMFLNLVGDRIVDIAGKTLLVCSDSQSFISALAQGPLDQDTVIASEVWFKLLELVKNYTGLSKIVIQFVPSHCGIQRNEEADQLAETSLSNMDRSVQRNASIPFKAIKATIKSGVRRRWKAIVDVDNNRGRIAGAAFSDIKTSSMYSRKKEITLAQLRTGECRLIGKFRKRVGIPNSDKCRWCRSYEQETVEHLFGTCTNASVVKLREEFQISRADILFKHPDTAYDFFESASKLILVDTRQSYSEISEKADAACDTGVVADSGVVEVDTDVDKVVLSVEEPAILRRSTRMMRKPRILDC